jgi:hypothetical protein
MIDRHYGHLARDGREHAIRLLDQLNAAAVDAGGRSVDAKTRSNAPEQATEQPAEQEITPKPSEGLEPSLWLVAHRERQASDARG